MFPTPLFPHPRPKIKPTQLGFQFSTWNRSPHAQSLYLGLPPAQLPCPFHHPHFWHTLRLLFTRLGQYQRMRSVLAVVGSTPSPPLDPSVSDSHHLKHPSTPSATSQARSPAEITERSALAAGVGRQMPPPPLVLSSLGLYLNYGIPPTPPHTHRFLLHP
jgi:hypothetical protein